eukprot:TRINITY_DN9806_c0_g1_i2.p1 TRINITY_DN9806_c0_g1~~TRINITY_DN9806_c0_g1_i2.p1  ORF type:complete len:897 (+),score=132.66 TRINITY_DN9806_c0_g1_i2:57-2693(+)
MMDEHPPGGERCSASTFSTSTDLRLPLDMLQLILVDISTKISSGLCIESVECRVLQDRVGALSTGLKLLGDAVTQHSTDKFVSSTDTRFHDVTNGGVSSNDEATSGCQLLEQIGTTAGEKPKDTRVSLGNLCCAFAPVSTPSCLHDSLGSSVEVPLVALEASADASGDNGHTVVTPASSVADPVEEPPELETSSKSFLCPNKSIQLAKFGQLFDSMDADGDGRIGFEEVEVALDKIGESATQARCIIKAFADSDQTDEITKSAWLQALTVATGSATSQEIEVLAEQLMRKNIVNKPPPWYMLLPKGTTRIAWDSFVAAILAYIAIMLPFTLCFLTNAQPFALAIIDVMIDSIFMIDIILNFFTGYEKPNGALQMEFRRVGSHYLCTWFAIDLVSSLPVEYIGTWVGYVIDFDTQQVKLLRGGKFLKAFRMLKLSKVLKLFETSELVDHIEEKFSESSLQTKVALMLIFIATMVLAHWLACLVPLGGGGFLENAPGVDMTSPTSVYLASYYWSITTMTTVGYGDLTPNSNTERVIAMAAMIIGGSYYCYVIGSFTSFVSKKEVQSRNYHERMDNVNAWLNRHAFPHDFRRRLRRYFKLAMAVRAPPDEGAILNALSPELRDETSLYLVTDEVRRNALFTNLPTGVLGRIHCILQQTTIEEYEHIVQEGDVGIAMYIVASGVVRYHQRKNAKAGETKKLLRCGDSFGEEIILSLEERYRYTCTGINNCKFSYITEEDFQKCFELMPDVVQEMRLNYMVLVCPEITTKDVDFGRSNYLEGEAGTGNCPRHFPDAVLDALGDIQLTISQLITCDSTAERVRRDKAESSNKFRAGTGKGRSIEGFSLPMQIRGLPLTGCGEGKGGGGADTTRSRRSNDRQLSL